MTPATRNQEVTTHTARVDPVTLEVVRHGLVAYADEMAAALRRTAYNPMIFEVQDYCVGIIDNDGGLIAQNLGGLPIFLADLGVSIADGVERWGLDGFEPGDALIMNHPYVCGQHLNNIVVYTPCFIDGKVECFLAVRAHWVDIGGARIGFGSVSTTDIFSEGLQLRNIKVLKAGEWDRDVMQMITDNIRLPESSLGDLRAAIAACRLGERRMAELAERYGWDTVQACIAEMRDQSEKLSRDAVSKMTDGEYTAEAWLDSDGQDIDRRIPIKARVIVDGSDLTIDLTEVSDQVRGPLNCGSSGGVAAARVAFKDLTLPVHPVDEGSFRNLHVKLREGSILNAKPPAPLGQWSIALPTVVDTIIRAMGDAVPGGVPAAHKGDMSGFTFYGTDPKTQSRFVSLNINGGGWGGRPTGDGPTGCVSVCQGDVRNIPVEILESRYPFLVAKHAIREDSGGVGENRGGLGVEIEVVPQQDMFSNVANERTTCPPWGINGGGDGAVNQTILRRPGSDDRSILKHTGLPLHVQDTITFRTAGGGGWGSAHARDAQRVVSDVIDGYVSRQQAEEQYGVVVGEDGALDEAATERLRAAHV